MRWVGTGSRGRGLALGAAGVLASARAVEAQTSAPLPIPVTGQATLPHDLSPWGMFLGADLVVKGVLVGLVFASVVTWTIALAKLTEIALARRRSSRDFGQLATAEDMTEVDAKFSRGAGVVASMVHAAITEVRRSGAELSADGIKERIGLRLQRIEAGEVRRMMRGTGILATIGATAPFVGLFGTVWGIMNSFIGISKSQTTNLAVVAPGIAEALLATAIGLVAAIPAVVVYNMFSRAISSYRAGIGDASAEIMRTVGRDLDRYQASGRVAVAGDRPALAAE